MANAATARETNHGPRNVKTEASLLEKFTRKFVMESGILVPEQSDDLVVRDMRTPGAPRGQGEAWAMVRVPLPKDHYWKSDGSPSRYMQFTTTGGNSNGSRAVHFEYKVDLGRDIIRSSPLLPVMKTLGKVANARGRLLHGGFSLVSDKGGHEGSFFGMFYPTVDTNTMQVELGDELVRSARFTGSVDEVVGAYLSGIQ